MTLTPRLFRLIALSLSCIALALSLAVSAQARDELTMGLITADSSETVRSTWGPILDDMADFVGVPVKPNVAGDYAGVIWLLAADKIQLAWLGNASAIEAMERTELEILVKSRNVKNGAGYFSHLIARKDSGLDDEQAVIDNANRLIFGNGDPNSTSGFAVPGYYLFAARGLDPNAMFKRIKTNNHEGNFLAAANGEVDVATSNSLALGRYKKKYPERFDRIKVIWTSPLIPSDPVVIRSDVDPELKGKVRDFFVQYGKPRPGKSESQVRLEQERLGARTLNGFDASDNSQLDPVRKLTLFKERLRIERNLDLSEDVKRQRIEAVDAQLQALEN